jgi:hypothetical protein
MSLLGAARKVAGAGGAAAAAYALVVRVEGKPIREKDKPATIAIAGLKVFERDAEGRQWLAFFRIRDARKD